MQESPVESSCPVCGDENSLKMIAHSTQIAYFGEHTQITLSCSTCGFKQTDFIPAEGKIPKHSQTFKIYLMLKTSKYRQYRRRF